MTHDSFHRHKDSEDLEIGMLVMGHCPIFKEFGITVIESNLLFRPYEHGSDIDLRGSLVLSLELDVSWEALTTLAVRGVSRRRRERWRSIRVLVRVLRRLQGQI